VFSNSKLVTATSVRAVPYLAVRCRTILPQIHNSVTTTWTPTAKIEQNLGKRRKHCNLVSHEQICNNFSKFTKSICNIFLHENKIGGKMY